MAAGKHTTAQRDFSAGEVDVTLKRSEDSEVYKRGVRQMSNFRITDAAKPSNRFGRSIQYIDGPRNDEVLMAPGQVFRLIFGNGYIRVRNAAGTQVFTSALKGDASTAIPWTSATVRNIRWVKAALAIYIAYADGFPANVPQVLTWDGVSQTSTWTLATYTEMVGGSGAGGSGGGGTSGGGGSINGFVTGGGTGTFAPGAGAVGNTKRTPFYRISPLNITLQPGAQTGSGVTVTASSPIFLAAHVGTRLRYCGAQMLITAVPSPPSATCTVTIEEILPGSQQLACTPDPGTVFSPGQVVIGSVTGAKAIVINTGTPAGQNVNLQLLQQGNSNTGGFSTGDNIVGPGGAASIQSASAIGNPFPVTVWDDEVMNAFRGYPSSVFFDNDRLGFCNFPSVPRGIVWSSIATPTDLYVPPLGVVPASAIMEVVPSDDQVQDVVPGAQSSEFVFCSGAVYEIPISVANPFSGTVGANFVRISGDGCAPVQPRLLQEVLVYINAGLSTCRAIMTIGAYNRANVSIDISEFHNHLFNNPIAIACPTADASYPERYFYVLNGDGTALQAKIDVENGQIKPNTLPGWSTISGTGLIAWISARAANVMFTTTYQPTVTVAEMLDPTQYVDAALPYNAVPTALTPPGGKGPLWWMPLGSCTVMDVGTRQLGLYQIDANGFLIPQNFGGENLASAQLMAGQAWTATLEPFAAGAPPGQDMDQRMDKRGIARVAAYFENSTGFLWVKLFSGLLTRTSPPYGAIMNTRRVTTYNQDDDATQAPFLREGTDTFRPGGQDYDPRIAIIKDTSGPLTILEIGMEISV